MLPTALNSLADRYIYYDMARQVLERDLNQINTLKFPEMYEQYIRYLLRKISTELKGIKKDLYRHQLRIVFDQTDPRLGTVEYHATWKGIDHPIRFSSSAIRNRTKALLLSLAIDSYSKL